jgi:polysaccharide export outer membrane protein
MRPGRLLTLLLIGLAFAGCARQPAGYGGAYAQAPGYYAAQGGPYLPAAGAAAAPYILDSGDRLRISVFGQEGLTSTYIVDAAGFVNMSLIGPVQARGLAPNDLSRAIAERLRQGYMRAPHVSVEVESYRPFFILGEVTAPGQYPYVANMTVETAIAIAGGFSARAQKTGAQLTRTVNGQITRGKVPLDFPLRPGDTITVSERWF